MGSQEGSRKVKSLGSGGGGGGEVAFSVEFRVEGTVAEELFPFSFADLPFREPFGLEELGGEASETPKVCWVRRLVEASFAARLCSAFKILLRALISSAFRMECHPGTPRHLAIWANCFTVNAFKSPTVCTDEPPKLRYTDLLPSPTLGRHS